MNRLGLVRALLAPAIWLTQFLASYIAAALVCAQGGDPAFARVLLLVLAALALLALTAVAATAARGAGSGEPARLLVGLSRGLALLSALAVVYTALPALWLADCR